MSILTAAENIHNLGENIWQFDFCMLFTIWLLYLVEFADWNSQATIGYGGYKSSYIGSTGYTNTMPYHTGTINSERTVYKRGLQYRNIEGLWDNGNHWIDGLLVRDNTSQVYIRNTPSNNWTSDSNGVPLNSKYVGGIKIGIPTKFSTTRIAANAGYIFWPSFVTTNSSIVSSGTSYTGDMWEMNQNYHYYCILGNDASQKCGLFSITYSEFGTSDQFNQNPYYGCRLMELP